MRIPGVDTVTRVPVPPIVRAVLAPVVRRSTTYAVSVAGMLDQLFDQVIAEVVSRVDVEPVLDRLDLTEIVLKRVDLDAVVGEVIGGLDESEIASLVAKVDVNGIARSLDVEAVLDRMDLTSIVMSRVDLVKVVDAVLARMDLTSIVVSRVDLVKVVDAVLTQMDLTSIVLERVDLVRVVDAVLAQMDLVALANQIIEGVDLPEIIRDSTGSMASETVKGVRMQGIGADQAVGRAVDRLLLRSARTTRPASP